LAQNETEIVRNIKELEGLDKSSISNFETEKRIRGRNKDFRDIKGSVVSELESKADSQIDERIVTEHLKRLEEESNMLSKKNKIIIDTEDIQPEVSIKDSSSSGRAQLDDAMSKLDRHQSGNSIVFPRKTIVVTDEETPRKTVINENKENKQNNKNLNIKNLNNEKFLGIKRGRSDAKATTPENTIVINKSVLAQKCSICLDAIVEKSKLDICEHEFCKDCINQWAEVATTCPLCKEEFKKIIYWHEGGQQVKKVRKRKFKYEQEDEDPWYENCAEYCMVCNKNHDSHLLLVCDKCMYNICHTYCAGLDLIPDEDWLCSECSGVNTRKKTQTAFKPSQEVNNISLSLKKGEQSYSKLGRERSNRNGNRISSRLGNRDNTRSESMIRNRESHRLGNRDNSRSESMIRNRESHRIEDKESRIRNRDSRHVNKDLRNGDMPAQRSTRANPNVTTGEKNNISVSNNGYAKKALTRLNLKKHIRTRRSLGIEFNNIELQNPKRKTKMKYSLRTKKNK
jgi:hypothetical protein